MNSKGINILLVDDHPVVLEGLASGLEQFPNIRIWGAAVGLKEACSLVDRGGFNLLLADLNLPEVADGLELIHYTCSRMPQCKIVVLTYSDHPDDIFHANQAGAHAYLVKDIGIEEIAKALEIVHGGGRPALSPDLEAALWQRLKESPPDSSPYGLNEREWKVLKLMTGGATNDEISWELFLSPRVVRRCNTSIYRKLGVRNRAEAAAKAVSEKFFK
jgi:DNA-binding NarL/FixJ family response regulator